MFDQVMKRSNWVWTYKMGRFAEERRAFLCDLNEQGHSMHTLRNVNKFLLAIAERVNVRRHTREINVRAQLRCVVRVVWCERFVANCRRKCVRAGFEQKLTFTANKEGQFVGMQLLFGIRAARPLWGKPDHSDQDAGLKRNRKSDSNQNAVCVAALLESVKARVSLVGRERFREAGLIAGKRQFWKICQVSTVGNGKVDEFEMLRQIDRNISRNRPELSRTNSHSLIISSSPRERQSISPSG